MVVDDKKIKKAGELDQFKFDLPPELANQVREVLARHRVSQRNAGQFIMGWFVRQSFTLQQLLLRGFDPDYEARIAEMVLEDVRSGAIAYNTRKQAAKNAKLE